MAFNKKKDKYRTEVSGQKLIEYRPKYKASVREKDAERDLPKICKFCMSAHALYDSDTMLCDRKGVVGCEYSCGRFMYDPLKHIPVQMPGLKVNGDELMSDIDDEESEGIGDQAFTAMFGMPENPSREKETKE